MMELKSREKAINFDESDLRAHNISNFLAAGYDSDRGKVDRHLVFKKSHYLKHLSDTGLFYSLERHRKDPHIHIRQK